MSFTVAIISPSTTGLKADERRKGDGFVDAVDAVDRSAIDHQHAGLRREQVGAAGEGALDIDTLAGNGLRDAGGGHVFGDVALLQPHHDDFLHAGLVERLDFRGTDRGALLEHQRTLPQRMHGDAANRVGRTGGTELHAACHLRGFLSAKRSSAVISAMIATAISDGDTAPMERPTGARMRAISASEAPCAFSRSAALGMGFREPQRADIEAVALKGVQQRRIIDLGIMRDGDERGVVIDVERRQRHVRPFGDQRHVGKALGTGKGGARVHHRHVVIERTGQRRQRLADMDRADDHEARGRRVDIEEQFLAAALDRAALAHAELL